MSRQYPMHRAVVAATTTIWLAMPTPRLPAEESAAQESLGKNGALQYRLVFIPEDQVLHQTRGYLTIKRDEFQRRIGKAQARSGPPGGMETRIQRADYWARLDADQLIDGKASLDIAHRGPEPGAVVLQGSNLAIQNPTWRGEPEGAARMGLSPDGELVALVTKSDILRFSWTLAGTPRPDGILSFRIQPPRCTLNRIWLELPPGLAVRADHGFASRGDPTDPALQQLLDADQDAAVEQMEKRANGRLPGNLWRIDWGGRSAVTIDVVSQNPLEDQRHVVLYRKLSTFDLSERGLELLTELRLQAHDQPLRQILLDLDPQLELTVARLADRHIPWSVLSYPENGTTRVILQLPTHVQSGEQRIRLGAIAPLSTEESWRLPDIRPVNLVWQEGTATLLVRRSLELRQLKVHQGRQSRLEPLPAPRGGESIELQYFDADGSCEVQVATVSSLAEVETHTAVTMRGNTTSARMVSDFVARQGERFQIEADVATSWVVESIRSDPADAVDEWSVDTQTPGKQRLVVQLREALRPRHDLRLIVQARRSLPPEGVEFGPAQLEPVRFLDVSLARRIVGMRAEEPYQLTIRGDAELNRLPTRDLQVHEEDSQEASHWDLVFAVDRGARHLGFLLGRSRPRYSADITMDAMTDGQSLIESYAVHCRPESSRVRRLVVHFTHARQEPILWSMPDSEGQGLLAQRLTSAQLRLRRLPSEGETWEINLRRSQTEPFTIHARRRSSLAGRQPLALAALPHATSQRGEVTVRSDKGPAIAIECGRPMTSVPARVSPGRETVATHATYRYEPSELLLRKGDVLTISLVDESARIPAASIWRCQCDTSVGVSGAAIHTATFHLENVGLDQVALRLPEGLVLQRLLVDGVDVPIRTSADVQRPLVVPLPAGVRYPTVVVQFANTSHALGAVDRVAVELPDLGLPILNRSWKCQLPANYAVWRSSQAILSRHDVAPEWSRRLFGPLAGKGDDPFDLFAVEDWKELLWSLDAEEAAIASVGNSTWRVQLADTGPTELTIYRTDSFRFYGWITFFATISVCWWAGSRGSPRAAPWALAVGLSGALTQWSPLPWAPIPAGALWGVVFCGVVWLTLPRRSRRPATASSSWREMAGSTTARTTAIILSVVGFPALVADASWAQQGSRPSADRIVPRIHKVLVPTVDQGKQAADYVFVPHDLYDLLHRFDEDAPLVSVDWLIRSAEYEGTLVWDATRRGYDVPELVAVYDVLVNSPGARIRLPLRQEDAHVLPRGVRLDGQAASVSRDERTGGLVVDVAQPGDYQLEVTLRPIPKRFGGATGFEIEIPEVANSRLRMQLASPLPEVRVNRAYGASSIDQQHRLLRAELGPTNSLSVSFRGGVLADEHDMKIDVEQLVWIRVRPGAVIVDAQFKFLVVNGPMRKIVLSTDPRLRWLSLDHEDPFSRVATRRAELQTIELDLKTPVEEASTLRTRFLLTDTSGIGNLQVPLLEVEGAQSVSKWLALSMDPSLEYEVTGDTEVTPAAISTFVESWVDSLLDPQRVYRLPPGRFNWNLATHLRAPRTTASQVLSLHIDSVFTEVELVAELSTVDGYLFQHRLHAPPALEIHSIRVVDRDTQDEANLVSRWSRDPTGHVHVFLSQPISGSHRLVLRGAMPTVLSQEMPIPWFEVDQARLRWGRLIIHRYSDVSVETVSWQGFRPTDLETTDESAAPVARQERSRLVVDAVCDNPDQLAAIIIVRKNQPSVSGRLFSRLYRKEEAWWTDVDIRIQVEGGQLDVLRFDAPTTWGQQIDFNQPVEYDWIELPDSDRRRLVVWPQQPAEGEFHLRMSGSTAVAAGQGMRVPDIHPLDVDVSQSLLAVPTHVDRQPIAWTTTQLVPHPLPPDAPANTTYYAVNPSTSGYFRAVARPQTVQTGSATIFLADIRMTLLSRERCYAIAAYDLEPSGTSRCVFQLPSGCQLVQLRVAGLSTTPEKQSDNTWQFGLHSDRLPQRIEIVFTGRLTPTASSGKVTLPAPRMLGIKTKETLWTVRCDAQPATPWTVVSGQPSSEYEHAARLFQSISELVIRSWQRVGEDHPDDLARWYLPWDRTLNVYRRRLAKLLDGAKPETILDANQRQQWNELQRQLRLSNLRSDEDSMDGRGQDLSPLVSAPQGIWEFLPARASPDKYVVMHGPAEIGPSVMFPSATSDARQRFGVGLGMLIGALLVGLLPARGDRPQLIQRWWPTAGVAVGVLWWLCLTPSLFGWLLVALSLFMAVRPSPCLRRAVP